MIGQRLSPILSEIEDTLLESEIHGMPPCYTEEGFRAAIKIFMSVLLDKMWELQEKEGMDLSTRADMAEKAGNSVRKLIKTFTNIDTHSLYEVGNK